MERKSGTLTSSCGILLLDFVSIWKGRVSDRPETLESILQSRHGIGT